MDKSGWHVYVNMEHFNAYLKEKGLPHGRGAYPVTDGILGRSINLSVGVVDAGLGAAFGINIDSTDEEIERAADVFKKRLRIIYLKETISCLKRKKNPSAENRSYASASSATSSWVWRIPTPFRNAGSLYDIPCDVEMTAVCAKDSEENLRAFADKFGWKSVETDWRKLVRRDDIDLVSVAAPGFLHKPMVLEAVRYGKHVLCEKPLANTLADAEEMLRAAAKAGVRHCCGYSYRSTPAQALAKQVVDEGRIGRIHHVHARYAQDWIVDPAFAMVWRFDKALAGSGSLGDICAHSIDAARFITGLEFSEVVGKPRDSDSGTAGDVPANRTARRPRSRWTTSRNSSAGSTTAPWACFEATRLATGGRTTTASR